MEKPEPAGVSEGGVGGREGKRWGKGKNQIPQKRMCVCVVVRENAQTWGGVCVCVCVV